MVGMVKWLTRRIVAPLSRGFDPHYSPHMKGRRQVVRQWTLTPLCAGSIPAAPANMTH